MADFGWEKILGTWMVLEPGKNAGTQAGAGAQDYADPCLFLVRSVLAGSCLQVRPKAHRSLNSLMQ